jgi:hypothetical protein
MFIISDEIEGAIYVDLILTPAELKRIERSEMISGEVIIRKRKYYLGVRLKGSWDYEDGEKEPEDERQDSEGFT